MVFSDTNEPDRSENEVVKNELKTTNEGHVASPSQCLMVFLALLATWQVGNAHIL